MKTDVLNRILLIVCALLAVAGLIFVCISIFSDTKDQYSLIMGLGCVALSNLFNIIRGQINRA